MKKLMPYKIIVSALATHLLLGSVAHAQNPPQQQPPEDPPERQALNRLLETGGPELKKNLDDMMQKMSEKDFLKHVHNNVDKIKERFPDKGFKQNPDMNLDSISDNGKPPKFEDPRLKMFTLADWNAIRKAPDAESRKTHIQEMQKKLGIENPSVSAAELLGAFLNEEKRFKVLVEKKAEEKAKEKEKAEKLAKNKDEPDTKDSPKDEKLDTGAEKKALKSGWKTKS